MVFLEYPRDQTLKICYLDVAPSVSCINGYLILSVGKWRTYRNIIVLHVSSVFNTLAYIYSSGNTDGHCGAGCQSGPCQGPPAIPVPGPSPAPVNPNQGYFVTVGQSGVPAMHAALMSNGRVVFLDKLEDYSQLRLPNGRYAMSSEFYNGQAVPLSYKTNAFCSGGAFLADGSVVSLGGNAPLAWLDPTIGDGFNAIRFLKRSATDPGLNGQNWYEAGMLSHFTAMYHQD